MRASLRACRKAACSLVSWATLTAVVLLGGSIVFILLMPVARDIARNIGATATAERRTVRADVVENLEESVSSIGGTPAAAFWIEPAPLER